MQSITLDLPELLLKHRMLYEHVTGVYWSSSCSGGICSKAYTPRVCNQLEMSLCFKFASKQLALSSLATGRAADEIRCSTDSKDMLATSRDIQLKLGAQPALWADGKKDIAEAASPGTPERPGSDGLVKDGKAMARASDSPACSDGNMLPMSDKAMVQSESGAQLSQPPPPPPQQQQQQTAAHMAGGGKSTNGRQQQPQQLLQNQVTRRRSSEEQGEEGSVRLHHHHHHHHSRQQSRRDWDHVLHVDPEEVGVEWCGGSVRWQGAVV